MWSRLSMASSKRTKNQTGITQPSVRQAEPRNLLSAHLYARSPCAVRSPRAPAGSSMACGHHQGQAPAPISSATPFTARGAEETEVIRQSPVPISISKSSAEVEASQSLLLLLTSQVKSSIPSSPAPGNTGEKPNASTTRRFCFPRTPRANMLTGRHCGTLWMLLRLARTPRQPVGSSSHCRRSLLWNRTSR